MSKASGISFLFFPKKKVILEFRICFGNKIIPVNEKGENVTNPKLLHKFYEQAKLKINKEKEKKLLPKKRMSVNPITFFFNPIKICA